MKRRTQTKTATPSGPNTNEMSKISIPNSLMPNFLGEHERAKACLFVLMRDIIVWEQKLFDCSLSVLPMKTNRGLDTKKYLLINCMSMHVCMYVWATGDIKPGNLLFDKTLTAKAFKKLLIKFCVKSKVFHLWWSFTCINLKYKL